MIEENLPLPPAKNALRDSCHSNVINKVCHMWNKFNKNQNCLVIEIDEKLFKDKQLSANDAEEHRDNFVRNLRDVHSDLGAILA